MGCISSKVRVFVVALARRYVLSWVFPPRGGVHLSLVALFLLPWAAACMHASAGTAAIMCLASSVKEAPECIDAPFPVFLYFCFHAIPPSWITSARN